MAGYTHENALIAGSNEMELVDFRIMKQEADRIYEGIYGVNVAKVNEIIRLPKLTEIPGVPPFVEGIFDLRGVVIPVVSLAKWLNITVPTNKRIKPRVIIAEFNNLLIGFIVHEAKRIRRINWKNIEPATFSSGNAGVDKSKITGVTRIENDEVLLILDLESIVEDLGLNRAETKADLQKNDIFNGLALVLEDSKIAKKIVRETLEKMGFTTVEASDGVMGFEKLEELYEKHGDELPKKLKIIISDIEMPKMDGFHFAAKVKDDPRFKKIPIVFNSSISNQFNILNSAEVGGEAYLVKFDANQFYQEIERVVKNHLND